MVPKAIPKDINILSEIKSEAGKQSSLPLFMFSKDHRFGAISIQTDFGTIPVIENQNEEQSLFSDDYWSDDFEDSVDDQAVLQKVKFKDIEPGLYIPFMQAVSAIYEQPKMLAQF